MTQEVTSDPEPGAVERVRVEILGVVRLEPPFALQGGLIAWVDPGHHAQRDRHVVDVSSHRTNRIERQGERDDAVTAYKAVRGFEPNDSVRG